jgi:hypothetical protein
MKMTPRMSKAMLTLHIIFSVGWIGAVVVFLVFSIVALTNEDNQLVRSSLIAMELSAWFAIVPFSLTSLCTGVVQAIGTKWGLFKHYWIILKLFLTLGSTILLILHLQPIVFLANLATDISFSNAQHVEQIINLIAKTGLAILVLVAITTISIFKPWGKVQFRKSNNNNMILQLQKIKSKHLWTLYVLIGLGILIIIFIISHIFVGGFHVH